MMRTVVGVFSKVLLLSCTLLFLASATHFRYGLIYYDQINPSTTGTEFWFQMQQAWRWTAYGSAAVNTNISIIGLYYDGTNYVDNKWTVNSANGPNDWFVATWIPRKASVTLGTGVTSKNFNAYTTSCCRISTLVNNKDGTWSLYALVKVVKNGNIKSMRSSLVPITTLRKSNAAQFGLNVLKYQNEYTSFTFSTKALSAANTDWKIPDNPTPTIQWDTGVISWLPLTPGLYSIAAVVYGHTAQPTSATDMSKMDSWFVIDWILEVKDPNQKVCKRFCYNLGAVCSADSSCTNCKENGVASTRTPYCDINYAPYITKISQPNGGDFYLVGTTNQKVVRDGDNTVAVAAIYKNQLTVNLTWADDDVEDYIYVGTGGIPTGAVVKTPDNGVKEAKNVVQFLWTPGDDDLGGAVVCFVATDSLGNNNYGQVCLLISVSPGTLSATIPSSAIAGSYTTFPVKNAQTRTHSLTLQGISTNYAGTVVSTGAESGTQFENYEGRFTAIVAGTYVVTVADSSSIALKPASAVGVMNLYPNVTYASYSKIYEQGSTGLSGGTVNSNISFFLRPYDFFNNTQSLQRNDSFFFNITYTAVGGSVQVVTYYMTWDPILTGGVYDYRYNGTYKVPSLGSGTTYTLKVYYKNLTSGDKLIATYTPSLLTNSFTADTQLRRFVAGKAVDFTFTTTIDTDQIASGTNFQGQLSGIEAPDTPVTVIASVTYNSGKNFKFSVSSNPVTKTGDYPKAILLSAPGLGSSGTALIDVIVDNDIPDKEQSSIFSENKISLGEIPAQEDFITVIVNLVDQYGNPCKEGAYDVEFEVIFSNGQAAISQPSNGKALRSSNDPQYFLLQFSPNTAGDFIISATVIVDGSTSIELNSVAGTIVPGAFSTTASTYVPQSSALREIVAGESKIFNLYAKDYLQNPRNIDGDVFSVTMQRAATLFKPALAFNFPANQVPSPNTDQYTVQYSSHFNGFYTVQIDYALLDEFVYWTTLDITVWAGKMFAANITTANCDYVKSNARGEIAIQTLDALGNVLEDQYGGRYTDEDGNVAVYDNFTQAYVVEVVSPNGKKSTWYLTGRCSKAAKKYTNCPTSYLKDSNDEKADSAKDKGAFYKDGVKMLNLSTIDSTLYQDGFYRVFFDVPNSVFNIYNYTVNIYLVNTQVVGNLSSFKEMAQHSSSFLMKSVVYHIVKGNESSNTGVTFNYFVVFGAAAGCFFVTGVGYGAFRLGRYRPKYKAEKLKADENEQILDEMRAEDNLVGGTGIGAVGAATVTMNPLHEANKIHADVRRDFAQERNPMLNVGTGHMGEAGSVGALKGPSRSSLKHLMD